MSKPHLYLVPRVERVEQDHDYFIDDDLLKALAEVEAGMSPDVDDNLPVWVPLDDDGRLKEERFWVTITQDEFERLKKEPR